MAKVISVGMHTAYHRECGAKIEFELKEASKEYITDYGGGGDWYMKLMCPNCHKLFSFISPV